MSHSVDQTSKPCTGYHGTQEQLLILLAGLGDVLVSSSSDDNVRIGSNVTLSCKITGNAVGTRFQWIDGSQKVVSNSSVFKINDIQRNESGKYSCKAAKENIVKMSGVVHITVTCKSLVDIHIKNYDLY